LRSLGFFSHTTLTSRHHTYRQAYTLVLSPLTRLVSAASSSRAVPGTTVNVKELFTNYPVRQSASRTNCQSELAQVQKITIGIGLSRPLALTLRDATGEKLIQISHSEEMNWETTTLEDALKCTLSLWTTLEDNHDHVRLIMKVCRSDSAKSYTFICIFIYGSLT